MQVERRRTALNGSFAPAARERSVSTALRAYAALVTSADTGAVRNLDAIG